MQSDALKDQARLWVIEKSVQILREHGKSDEEICSIITSDFHIDGETLNKILNHGAAKVMDDGAGLDGIYSGNVPGFITRPARRKGFGLEKTWEKY